MLPSGEESLLIRAQPPGRPPAAAPQCRYWPKANKGVSLVQLADLSELTFFAEASYEEVLQAVRNHVAGLGPNPERDRIGVLTGPSRLAVETVSPEAGSRSSVPVGATSSRIGR